MTGPPVSGHEWRTVATLSLGFGLVGIDWFRISTLYPTIARDLDVSYGDIGTITGVLALAWGFAAVVLGNLSDRVKNRPVPVGSLIAFSPLIGGSGPADWRAVLRFRNLWLLIGGLFCRLTCLIVTSTFLPNFLIDHLKLDEA